jgi:phosphoglucosamine mutase
MLEGKIQSEIDNMANDLAILIEEKANEKANC